jgi:hypothetical protein
MAAIYDISLTADGNAYVTLKNTRGNRNIYTVHLTGTFGSGTITAFTNPEGKLAAAAGTTYDVAILDSTGSPISKTSNSAFNFECDSDEQSPTILKLILVGATNPNIKIKVCNIQ